MSDDISRRCSIPAVRSISSASSAVDMSEDRRLPPLPPVEPLPRGPFNPFTSKIFAASPSPGSQDAFPVRSPWSATSEPIMTPPSPANSADSSWPEPASQSQKLIEWPQELTPVELLNLIAPKHISRKPPLQQLCGRKRKGNMISADPDDQREKHRIAEGNRRKNLSQLHREMDGRIHDFFLERAGWNPSKSLTESKEHIVQAAIFLIDFMLIIIIYLLRMENEVPPHLAEKLHSEFHFMQLQQTVSSLHQQNQTAQQQLKAAKQESQVYQERIQALELQVKSYEHMFRSPKNEHPTSQPLTHLAEAKPRNMLPGMRVFCDEIGASGHESSRPEQSIPMAHSHSFGHPYISRSPPITGPSSPAFAHASYSVPVSRRPSFNQSP
ncbi:hypothetical protein BO70DRAFT_223659 [Aspergillus heteromorphus CBS 117.55]|uniref:HLH DNA binding domain protein n=1 Tax=Aspergillus heteromorphus CBS 117.55 TaxID=1448321 RepID=A0A317WPL3_9EURO|nr:uncharacterized protein BO70DRAFT_223659 [Aspergillus heteromorphus CBS 117.55]PWY86230.1 hypothetical protein BO70DRAFT_223659 [Aspergillus heteromorphus CBS 117.55]